MPAYPPLWQRLTQDKRVITGRLRFRGLVLFGPAADLGMVTVYDGQDAGGRRFGAFPVGPLEARVHELTQGVAFDLGLYADMSAGLAECVVLYDLE